MEKSTDLTTHLDRLNQVDLDLGLLSETLAALTGYLHRAVPSYVGLQLVVRRLGQDVILSSFEPGTRSIDIATSLWLAVQPAAEGKDEGGLTFYATLAGAWVDLAAEQTYARRHAVSDDDETAAVRLDGVLTPTTLSSGLTGVPELATINRAIGWLTDRGHEQPEIELVRRAAQAGVSTHDYATELLDSPPAASGPETG